MLETDAERVYWKRVNQDYMNEESQDEDCGTINVTVLHGHYSVSFC